jgi:2-oxoglutarate dehydrogenase E2 component (dihydrolipoamide succinyltransferase)
MSAEIRVPQLGESVVEATVGRWLKSEGDAVAVGDPLVELETDKVNMEVPSTAEGTLRSIVKPEGETVGIGDVIAVIAERQSGDGLRPSSEGAPTETPRAGAVEQLSPGSSPTSAEEEHRAESAPENGHESRATPLARRIAEEHHVDLKQVRGTGPSGRVRKDDVTAYLEQQGEARPAPTPSAPGVAPRWEPLPADQVAAVSASLPQIEIEEGRREERVRMSRRRQTIAQRLVEAQHNAAMLTTFNEVDMTAIIDLRKRRRDAFKERYGVSLGFMSFFTRAVIGALKTYPRLNAEIQGNEIILKHYYDIGIAVGVEEGLVVPVVRDADQLTFAEIEREIATLAEKSRNNTLSLSELQGGTFTITNGGVYGSLLSTPILNAPQVGILGMHKVEERPIALDGEVVIRPMMYVALSYDHRIVDGNEAVRFLVRVKELLEDPETLLLEG